MTDFPNSVVNAVETATEKHPNDIPAAVEMAVIKIKQLPEYNDLVDRLVTNAVRDMIYDVRHVANVRMKRQTGYYGKPAKVKPGDTPTVNLVYESVYNYHIAGTTLGELKGADLPALRESEHAIAEGHRFNSELLAWLVDQKIPEDKKVCEAVPAKRLKLHFDRIYRKVKETAA